MSYRKLSELVAEGQDGYVAVSGVGTTADPLVFEVQAGAGENVVGTVVGALNTVAVTPAVAADAHAAGDCIGPIMTFAALARADGKTGYVTAAQAITKVANTEQIDLFVFNASPSNSTTTDSGAFSLHVDDMAKLIGVIPVSNWYAGGTPGVGFNDTCRVPVDGQAADDLYVVAVARGTITFTGTSDITFKLTQDQN